MTPQTIFICIFLFVIVVAWLAFMVYRTIQLDPYDPVYNCDVYRKEVCSHVDGMQCDMKTCKILSDYKLSKKVGECKK